MVQEISCIELKSKMDAQEDFQLLDVREANELEVSKLHNAIHIPLGELESRHQELNKSKPIFVLCRSGKRSFKGCEMLENLGYNATNIEGGILQWSDDIDPSLQKY